jgi:hypothetical protein
LIRVANIHLNDSELQPNRESPGYDKLYKVRPLLDKLSETFLLSYKPSKNQAIDESMIRFKGRSSLRQYMRLKPIKRGYKVWIRAGESGYVNQFQIYVGKVGNDVEKNFGARVVKDLTRNIVGKGYNLYFDNLFNSVGLQKDLQDDVIYACGTFRKGRKGFIFIDVALVNSFIIYKDRSSEKIESLEHFRLSVMIGLIGAAPNKTRKGRPSNDTPVNNFKVTVRYEIRFNNCAHLPVHGNSRRCAFCSTRKEHHRTVWTCTLCQVGLCLSKKKNCFAKFHTK